MTPSEKRTDLLFGLTDLKASKVVYVARVDIEAAGLPVPSDAKRHIQFTAGELEGLIFEANLADRKADDAAAASTFNGEPQAEPSASTFNGEPQAEPSASTFNGEPQAEPSTSTFNGEPQAEPSDEIPF